MAQVRSDNILADVNKLLDDKTGVAGSSPAWRPYDTVAEFVTRFSTPSTTNLIGVSEGQLFWVRNPSIATNADLYSVRSDKTTYKLIADISTETQAALDGKVPITRTVNSKALSSNIVLNKTDFIDLNNLDNTSDANKPISTLQQAALNNKVDKENGKGLYPDIDKVKLATIAAGAEVNVNADWNATSGDSLILNKPNVDLSNFYTKAEVNAKIPLKSSQVVPTATDGTVYFVTINELGAGKTIDFVCRSGGPFYTVSVSASDANKYVTYDPSTKRVTFDQPFYPNEYVWVQYRSA